MSRTKPRRASWIGWLLPVLLIAGSGLLWLERQFIVDLIQYQQFRPTAAIQSIVSKSGMTDDAKFTFYATRPAIEPSESFNDHCQRKEADSPILGCYSLNRIYIYDITDKRLSDVKVVTAAHELLHAEYQRLSNSERDKIDALLLVEYQKSSDPELKKRMEYYDKTEPGQSLNELHSIVGTEFNDIHPELETYYKKYLIDRQRLVGLHVEVEALFTQYKKEAEDLAVKIEQIATRINANTAEYNANISSLNEAADTFNRRANQPGGFTTQEAFQAARDRLVDESNALADFRQRIQADISQYKTLVSELEAINAEAASLSKSLDSMLSETPKL